MQNLMDKVNENRAAYDRIIAEMRAMGLDDKFIAQFLDDGKADDIAQNLVKRSRKNG